MTLQQFYDALNGHDWYYNFSDDGSVSRRGYEREKQLREISIESPEHKALYEGFRSHYFTGKGWGNEKTPKPTRPE